MLYEQAHGGNMIWDELTHAQAPASQRQVYAWVIYCRPHTKVPLRLHIHLRPKFNFTYPALNALKAQSWSAMELAVFDSAQDHASVQKCQSYPPPSVIACTF